MEHAAVGFFECVYFPHRPMNGLGRRVHRKRMCSVYGCVHAAMCII